MIVVVKDGTQFQQFRFLKLLSTKYLTMRLLLFSVQNFKKWFSIIQYMLILLKN